MSALTPEQLAAIKKGDWIAFTAATDYRVGEVLAVVQTFNTPYWEYYTTHGMALAKTIVEVRAKAVPA